MGEELRKQVEKIVKINDSEWDAFQKILKPKQIKKNELFLEQGQVCRHMAFIEKGYVRFYFLMGAEEVTKEFNFDKTFCGSYASFITGNPYRFNVKAMEDLLVTAILSTPLYVQEKKGTHLSKDFFCSTCL